MSSTPAPITPRGRAHGISAVAGHLVVAVALIVVSISQASIVLPVAITLPASGGGVFAGVDLAAAAAVVLLVSATTRAVTGVLSAREGSPRRTRTARLIELSQVAGITVFLVAQLNGVSEAGTLVLCYAVAASSVGMLWVQGRGPVEHRGSAWPYSLAAALAIVPWGVVGLYQVVAIVAATPPSPLVRALTVVILLLAAAVWLVERRWQVGALTDGRADALHTILTLANGVALLAIVVGLARPSALL